MGAVARELDEDAFGERFHADLAEHVDDEQVLAAITQASDPRLEYAGLARYWRKLGNDRHPTWHIAAQVRHFIRARAAGSDPEARLWSSGMVGP